MAAAKRLPDFRSLSVTLLELLAGTAPARVVAAELLLLAANDLLRGDALGRSGDCTRGGNRGAGAARCAGDRARARGRLVLVREAAVDGRLLLERRHVLRRELGVEQRPDDLLADLHTQLLEHALTLAGVLDERVLLRERAQVYA